MQKKKRSLLAVVLAGDTGTFGISRLESLLG